MSADNELQIEIAEDFKTDNPVGRYSRAGKWAKKIAAQDALLHRAAEMLRRLEWRDYGDIEKKCPVCYGWGKHDKGCEFAALIRELESRLAL